MMNEVPERLWTYLMVDFITKLLLVAEKDVIREDISRKINKVVQE